MSALPRGVRGSLAGGAAVIVLLGLGVGWWAALTEISGAVIADGVVAVSSGLRRIQHPTGGIVGQVLVRNGDVVQRGDVLIRLDETTTRASVEAIKRQTWSVELRKARLIAERDGADMISLSSIAGVEMSAAAWRDLVDGEIAIFETRRATIQDKALELRSRIEQFRLEAEALQSQIYAKQQELDLIADELKVQPRREEGSPDARSFEIHRTFEPLVVSDERRFALKRDAARLAGEKKQLEAHAQQLTAKSREQERLIAQLGTEVRRAVLGELAEVQAKLAELDERRVLAEDQLARVDLKAPETGVVHDLSVSGIGAVIGAGEVVMLIVPREEALVVEARIAPRDVDQILAAHDALVRLPTLNRGSTPELMGYVTRISADLERDHGSGAVFFLTRVEIAKEALDRLEGLKLVPGMPAEIQIQTSRRSALSYLIKPLADQIVRAWRED